MALPSPDATQLVGEASLPTHPYSPDYARNLVLAFILGAVLAVSVAFLRERFDDRMAWRDDFEEIIGAPVLAVVPRVPSWRKRKATKLSTRDDPRGAAAEAYRTVRTNLEFVARTGDKKILVVASPSMGEGKTTTTANLAVSLAQTGKYVIALSCDLRKPRLHKFFDLSNDRGVTTILKDGASVLDVIQRTGVDNLRLISSGPVPHNPAELLGSKAMAELISDLRRLADYIVIDTAPVLQVADCLVIAPQTDGVILVVDASSTTKAAVRVVSQQLDQVGAEMLGGIFNDFDPNDAKSYPGYYKYYYYGYGRKNNPYHGEKNGQREKESDPSHEAIDPLADIWSKP